MTCGNLKRAVIDSSGAWKWVGLAEEAAATALLLGLCFRLAQVNRNCMEV